MGRALQPGLNDSATSTAARPGRHHASHRWPARILTLLGALALSAPAQAAGLDGSQLSLIWAVPFVGILLSIAIWPLAGPHFWHHHYGKISAAWAAAFLMPFALLFGPGAAWAGFVHAALAEYVPFILLLVALFTVSGGIYIRGNLRGTPALNTLILLVGGVLASFMGTTGASMLLIRPLIRANDNRKSNAHVVIFFIFIVSNIGGSLTPLGDPPLFLGFLKGVTFFWTVSHILPDTLFLMVVLLAMFFALDSYLFKHEGVRPQDPTPTDERFGFDGAKNFILLGCVVALVLMSGIWKPGIEFDIYGTHVGLPGLVRDVGMIVVTLISLAITPKSVHDSNQFGWAPMQEVAKLFAGIFLTIIPVIAMLQAGVDGAFGAVVRAVTNVDGTPNPAMYFWATGMLSGFLDNAPTYLVFFNTAGGDAVELMGPLATTLAAVSAGSVFMGALTYIGNAPNLMVKAIAEDRGVKMPSFFGYMVWSFGILVPLYIILTFLFFV
ncbi:MAG: sodium:proton antiporter [Burkholderiales bacterium]|nr:sodium:proton antiporter [Burkholderiales bacterium]